MLKKLTYILFLFLAHTIVLAHEMIPHHHHEDQLCFEHQGCIEHHNETQEAEQNPSDDSECCPLSGLVVINPTSQQNEFCCVFCLKEKNPVNQNTTILATFHTADVLLFTPLPFRQKPFISCFLTQYAPRVLGSRGPPVC